MSLEPIPPNLSIASQHDATQGGQREAPGQRRRAASAQPTNDAGQAATAEPLPHINSLGQRIGGRIHVAV